MTTAYKIIFALIISLLMQVSIALASTSKSFTVFVNVPEQTRSVVTSNATTPVMSFDPLTYDSKFGIYRPPEGNSYYFIDVSSFKSVQITYSDTSYPAGALKTLGEVAHITLMKVEGSSQSSTETLISKHPLKNLNNTVQSSLVKGGWLRMYIGLSSGEKNKEPEGVSPFTAKDKPGQYTGTLTLTITAS